MENSNTRLVLNSALFEIKVYCLTKSLSSPMSVEIENRLLMILKFTLKSD